LSPISLVCFSPKQVLAHHGFSPNTTLSTTMSSDTSPLYLGLDCSTQALKAVLTTSSLQVITEYRVDFSKDLPQYGTKSGVLVDEKDGSIMAPVKMYVEAMDKVMDGLREQ
jgi:xylulokinase